LYRILGGGIVVIIYTAVDFSLAGTVSKYLPARIEKLGSGSYVGFQNQKLKESNYTPNPALYSLPSVQKTPRRDPRA